MNKLTIIGTSHISIENENGRKCANILYSIIENIKPNVIFEEITFENYKKIYVNQEDSKFYERIAIKNYIKNHKIENIPIDTLEEPCDYIEAFNKLNLALNYKNVHNEELYELMRHIDNFINNNDINNINTKYFEELLIKRKTLMIDYIYNYMEQLIPYYRVYDNYISEDREKIMVNNIIEYTNKKINNNFNAVLIIGVAHKLSIKNKLENINNIESELYSKTERNGT